ncbi:hypothetical protein D3C83_117230 [compost metagenome]
MEKEDDIDLDKIVWDAGYRRAVIERLNRKPMPMPGRVEPLPAPVPQGITIR